MYVLRFIVIFLLFYTYSFCQYEKVKIGHIDSFYSSKINYEELREIIDEIEFTFEDQLGINVFDYSENGKAIDILYMPASKLERRIKAKTQRLKNKKKKIEKLQNSFYEKQEEIDILKSKLTYQNDVLNNKVEELNEYVRGINKEKNISKDELSEIKKYVNSKKKQLNKEIKALQVEQRALKRKISRYNQSIFSYNNQIKTYNRLNNEIESMSRSFKKVKGKTFGHIQTTHKTYYKNGEKIEEKTTKSSMNKIEIYGFDSIAELKAVLAHEIAHLVGIPHINSKGSLMNPILQKNQIEKLELNYEDIRNFQQNF